MIICHIGYAKTGTTSLQKHLFSKLDEAIYFGRNHPIHDDEILNEFANKIHMDDEVQYLEYSKIVEKRLQSLDGEKCNIISHENFLRPYKIDRIASRLKEMLLPHDAYIVITIRNQFDLICSRLNHDLNGNINSLKKGMIRHKPYECAFPSCVISGNSGCPCFKDTRPISLPYYDFLQTVRYFEKAFGKKRIFIWSFEKIINADELEIDNIASNLQVDFSTVQGLLNVMEAENNRRGDDHGEFKNKIYEKYGKMISNYYKKSNEEFYEKFDLGIDPNVY